MDHTGPEADPQHCFFKYLFPAVPGTHHRVLTAVRSIFQYFILFITGGKSYGILSIGCLDKPGCGTNV
jgi:hypothetical protein